MPAQADPEWITVTIADASILTPAGRRRCCVQVGRVRLPDGGGERLAMRLDDDPDNGWVILPPRSAAELLGALRHGLSAL